MRGKWPLVAGLIVLFAVAAGVVTVVRKGSRPSSKAVQPVAQAAIPLRISLPGRVQAKKIVSIPVPTEGIVERFMADVGEDVFEGELLARIKNAKIDNVAKIAEEDAARSQARVADLEAGLTAARLEGSRARADATRTKAEFDKAEKIYQRQKMLVREGATPRLTFEKAEAEYNKLTADNESFGHLAAAAEERVVSTGKELENARKLAQAKSQEMDEAKADLGAGEVHSPVDGVVLSRHGQAGEAVSRAMQDLFQIGTELTSLQVVLNPDSKLLPKFRAGQPASIQIAEALGAIQGSVREVKAGEVFVDFANPLPAIKPGLTAQVTVELL